jgi:hypothetical protein
MPYSNAIFYINLTSGSDAARTALTGCVASNPSGSTVRINKTGHGLVTGAIVDLTLFDSYLNDAWKITVVDADNFDLDTAVWSIATVDNNGTVTPRGGSSWTDGWLTISSGPTAARTQLGDTIRLNKTGDPVSLGNATWTNLSKTVTLATAQTTTIEQGEAAYTTVNAGGTASSSTRKQGSASRAVFKNTSATANTLYGYRNLGTTLNLSSYDAITLWVQYYSTTAFPWRICLCSDTAGVNIVDDFIIPQVGVASTSPFNFFPLVITRVGGGNLGSSIQSVAIYTGSGTPNQTSGLWFDNISACSSTGLNLTSLISKNSSAFGGSEAWYPIQSIDGTTVLLDGHATTIATGGRGYYGASETVTTYFRNLFRTTPQSSQATAVNTINEGGTAQYPITYSGGWNTSTNLQDGETIYDGGNGLGYGVTLNSREYVVLERISAVRYYRGFTLGSSPNSQITIPNLIGNTEYGYAGSGRNFVNITNIISNNVGIDPGSSAMVTCQKIEGNIADGVELTSADFNVYLSASSISNNGSFGIDNTGGCNRNIITAGVMSDNGTAAIRNTSGDMYLFNSTLSGTEFAGATTGYDGRVFSTNHDLSGYAYIYTDGGTIDQRASTFTGGSGAEWRLSINSSTRNDYYPLKLPVAQYAVASGSLLIVSASMKKSHATDVVGRLVIPGGQLFGVPNDVVATLADNTNEQGLTVSCTPTMSGVLGVEVWAEYVNNTGTVSVDTVTARV